MVMKTCPACRKQIDERATKCPHCHTVFDGMQMEIGRKEAGRRRMISFAVAIVALFAAAYLLTQPEFRDKAEHSRSISAVYKP